MLEIKYIESPMLHQIPWIKRDSYRPENPDDAFSDGVWVYVRQGAKMPWWSIPSSTCVMMVDILEG